MKFFILAVAVLALSQAETLDRRFLQENEGDYFEVPTPAPEPSYDNRRLMLEADCDNALFNTIISAMEQSGNQEFAELMAIAELNTELMGKSGTFLLPSNLAIASLETQLPADRHNLKELLMYHFIPDVSAQDSLSEFVGERVASGLTDTSVCKDQQTSTEIAVTADGSVVDGSGKFVKVTLSSYYEDVDVCQNQATVYVVDEFLLPCEAGQVDTSINVSNQVQEA